MSGKSRWQRVAGTITLPILALAVLLLPLPAKSGAPTARTVRIEASQFQYDPGVVAVNAGDTVTLEVVAADVVHGLYLDGYDLEVTADPGQTARLTFVADRPGVFRFRCSVSCGAMHPFMIGKLRVGGDRSSFRDDDGKNHTTSGLLWRGLGLGLLAVLGGLFFVREEAG